MKRHDRKYSCKLPTCEKKSADVKIVSEKSNNQKTPFSDVEIALVLYWFHCFF